MGRVLARRGEEISWQEGREVEINGKKQWGLRTRRYFAPTVDPVYFNRVNYAAGYTEPPHSHTVDEIIYIMEGELQVGDTRYIAGDTLWIEANTVYGPLTAGPQGMTFLLIRNAPAEYVPST